MSHEQVLDWLLENGGPTIRCRVAAELLDDPACVDLDGLAAALLESPLANGWLDAGADLAADLDEDSDVDFADYAGLAYTWLDELLWPQP